MGTPVEQSGELVPRTSRAGCRHFEDLADSVHRLSPAAEDLQVIIPRCNRTLLLQGEIWITLIFPALTWIPARSRRIPTQINRRLMTAIQKSPHLLTPPSPRAKELDGY